MRRYDRPYTIDIPEADAAVMREHPSMASKNTAGVQQTLLDIGWRLYTEACMSREPREEDEVYTNWRDREVHFALEREGSDGSNGAFERIREEVINAIVTRAGEVFAEWGGHWAPHRHAPTSQTNLRASLKRYLDTAHIDVDV